MLVEPTADAWGRSSSKVRLQLRAGRCRAAGRRTGGCQGQDLILPSALPLHSGEFGLLQSTHQFCTEANRQNINSSTPFV
jgi:hypothetical protein